MPVIQFFHRGEIVKVPSTNPTQTVLQWLREDAHCHGTKEGCNEGDCGACTVVIGTPTASGGLDLNPVNSCIQFLPTLHGKALITVEDLGSSQSLHPCQNAMIECHGSQCGFCTPGFVMTLFSHYERTQRGLVEKPTERETLDDLLSGNLCRCTGYRPILDAAKKMFDLPPVRFDDTPILSALRAIQPLPSADTRGFFAPTTRERFATYYAAHTDARILAGSTDIGLWVTKEFRAQDHLLYIGDVEDLKFLNVNATGLRIGAAVHLETAFRAIATHVLPKNASFRQWWMRFASPLIRNAGTLAGNIANGSPIGDSMPVLIALNARVLLQRGDRTREMLLESLYLDYMKNALQTGEFVAEVIVPIPSSATQFRTYKISKRFDQDISAVCFAAACVIEDGIARDVRVVLGGMAAIPKRAKVVESELEGKHFTLETIHNAMRALPRDVTPLSDLRASAHYRMQVAQNLLLRFWHETRPDQPASELMSSVRFVEQAL